MKAPSIIPNRESCFTDLTVDQPPLPPSSSHEPIPLENILDSLDDAIIVLNRQGIILKANPSFCRLFTSSAEGLKATGNPLSVHVCHGDTRIDFEGEDVLFLQPHGDGWKAVFPAGKCLINGREVTSL